MTFQNYSFHSSRVPDSAQRKAELQNIEKLQLTTNPGKISDFFTSKRGYLLTVPFQLTKFQTFFFFFLIQFNVPFKIISLIETSQSIGGRNGRTPGKPPDTPASRTWLVSHVASAGLEPTPDTAVR